MTDGHVLLCGICAVGRVRVGGLEATGSIALADRGICAEFSAVLAACGARSQEAARASRGYEGPIHFRLRMAPMSTSPEAGNDVRPTC